MEFDGIKREWAERGLVCEWVDEMKKEGKSMKNGKKWNSSLIAATSFFMESISRRFSLSSTAPPTPSFLAVAGKAKERMELGCWGVWERGRQWVFDWGVIGGCKPQATSPKKRQAPPINQLIQKDKFIYFLFQLSCLIGVARLLFNFINQSRRQSMESNWEIWWNWVGWRRWAPPHNPQQSLFQSTPFI